MQLFPEMPAVMPPGFSYFPNFLTHNEESDLISHIRLMDLKPFLFQGYEAKRKVASFGIDYRFDMRALKPGKDIPMIFDPLIAKVAELLAIERTAFKELLVIEYPPGAVINWHRDAPPFEVIAGISLHGSCVFKFRPYQETQRGKKSTLTIPLHCRSLYVIRGDARSQWQHATAPVENLRYSITLRTLR